ncbi:MAG: hypothetical protein QM538_05045 [Methylacidiphilales bacterium]|nr:hypothetical protein [Candidatus Methylacidiphilales bacterium]
MKRIIWSLASLMVIFSFVLLFVPAVKELFVFDSFFSIKWYMGIIVMLVVLEGLYIVLPVRFGGAR